MFLVLGSAMFSIGGVKTVIESHQTRKTRHRNGVRDPKWGTSKFSRTVGFRLSTQKPSLRRKKLSLRQKMTRTCCFGFLLHVQNPPKTTWTTRRIPPLLLGLTAPQPSWTTSRTLPPPSPSAMPGPVRPGKIGGGEAILVRPNSVELVWWIRHGSWGGKQES